MTAFCTDEHVPSVFVTTLRSNGRDVVRATDVFGEGTDDRQLLEYCGEHDRLLITHDKKDFSSTISEEVDTAVEACVFGHNHPENGTPHSSVLI